MLNKIFHSPKSVRFQWRIILPVAALCIIGILTLYSTGNHLQFTDTSMFKQLIWLCIGGLLFLILQYIRIQFLYETAFIFYGLLIIALLLTYLMPTISGAKRWIIMGPISFQPSEFGKLILIFTLAKFLTDQHDVFDTKKIIINSLVLSIVPAMIVFKQPDLGTAVIYMSVVIPMLYWSGIKPFYLFIMIAPIISILTASSIASNSMIFSFWIAIIITVLFFTQPKLWTGIGILLINIGFGTLSTMLWNKLYIHQQERILTLLDPMRDPQGTGYQIIQSITAIGSGGISGKGLGEGLQTHLRFLPVRDTDFIVSVIGEEMGFVGILSIILIAFILIYWMVNHAQVIHNKFSSLVMIGIGSMLFFHLFINMGMTVGLFPVTGLPAPFISYGGTFLLTSIIGIAISNNIISNNL